MTYDLETGNPNASGRNSPGQILFAVTLLGALLLLAVAMSSAVVQAGNATVSTANLNSVPNALHWHEITPVTSDELNDVYMMSATDGWAVGVNGTVLRYNGTTWNPVPISTTGRLVDINMLNPTDGFILDRENSAVYRWNGAQWSLFYTANHNLNRLSAISANDVWVSGLTTIYHCNPCPASGGTWTSSFVDPQGSNIFTIQMYIGSQGVEGWAGGAATGDGQGALLMHYFNGVWTRYLPSPSSTVLYNSFFTVPTDGWAMGYTATTYVLRYNGTAWTRAYTPTEFLDNLYMLSPTEGWFSGPFGDIDHFLNGNFIPEYVGSNYFTSIFMVSQTDGWAVGAAGLMAHYVDDSTATPTAIATATATRTSTSVATSTSTATIITGSPTASPTSSGATPTSTVVATATACGITFSDVPADSAFYTYIRCLVCRGIISGYGDGTFRPGNNITRGQIAKLVSNAAGFNDDPGPQIYEDVDSTNTFYTWINRLSNLGFIGGYPCGTVDAEPCNPPDNLPYFRPFANATRGQLAKIVSNAAGLSGTPTGIFYTDVQEDNAFYTWIMRLTDLGVMSGYDCGGPGEPCDSENRPYFRPFANVTRGQASKIVANTFLPDCQTPSR